MCLYPCVLLYEMAMRNHDALSLGSTYDCHVCQSSHTPSNVSPVCIFCYQKIKSLEVAGCEIDLIVERSQRDWEIARSMG